MGALGGGVGALGGWEHWEGSIREGGSIGWGVGRGGW